MAGISTPIGILAVGGGFVLVWSAVTGDGPLAELRKALTSGQVDGGKPTPIRAAASGAGLTSTGSGVDTSTLGGILAASTSSRERVPIGQGSHKLAPGAVTAFRQAEQNYGRTIPITDSSRSFEHQRAQRAKDPSRFGPPEGNAHVEGRAVDVNLQALGVYPQGEPTEWMSNAGYAKLANAMMAAGWCNYQLKNGTANGRDREPWHFSIGRCN